MTLKKQDFVEIEYTGRIEETDEVFDTTDAEVAKQHNIHDPNSVFGPVVVCLGEGFVLQGLERKLLGRETGECDVELLPEEGFGKKSTKLIQLVPTVKFTKQKVVPVPGLQINIDGLFGMIKAVSGGRTVVDFNHPLSGKVLRYHVNVRRVVNDGKEKAAAVLKWKFRLEALEMKLNDKALSVILKNELPKNMKDEITKNIVALTNIESVNFQKRNERREAAEPKLQ